MEILNKKECPECGEPMEYVIGGKTVLCETWECNCCGNWEEYDPHDENF